MFGGGVGGGGGGGRENETRGLMSHMMMPLPPLQLNPTGNDDDEFPKRDERVPQWTHQETRDFISIRAELERDFTVAKRNKTLWEVVSGRMKELGYRRSADQCKCKWKNLVNRYKGKETTDQDSGRQCPFFEELHAVFTDRETKMHRTLLESESGSTQGKKRAKRISGDQSSEDLSDDEYEDAQSDEQRATKAGNPKKQKVEKEKRLQPAGPDKSSRQPNTRNVNPSNSLNSVQEMLQGFLQQQQRMEMMWRESMERHAYQRQMFEQEWRQSMEKLERERMMVEQAWREREDQRRIREESRAEKRDALLTMLVNKLIREDHTSSR